MCVTFRTEDRTELVKLAKRAQTQARNTTGNIYHSSF